MHPYQHNYVVAVLPATCITVGINHCHTCIKYSSHTLTFDIGIVWIMPTCRAIDHAVSRVNGEGCPSGGGRRRFSDDSSVLEADLSLDLDVATDLNPMIVVADEI